MLQRIRKSMALMALARKDFSKFLLRCRLIPSITTASVPRRSFSILPTQVHKPDKPNFVRPSCLLSAERHISSFHTGHPFLNLSLKLSTMLTMINDCQSTQVMAIICQNLDMLKKVEAYLEVVGNVTKDKTLVDKVKKLPPDAARKLYHALMVKEYTNVAEFLGMDKKLGANDNENRRNAAADISFGRGRAINISSIGSGINISSIGSGINIISIGCIHISSITIAVN